MTQPAHRTARIKSLDSLRGLAAGSVALFHYTAVYDYEIGYQGTLPFAADFGQYGVELFFIISGFVILMTVERSRDIVDFIISRFSRLFPAFWVAVLLTSAVWYFRPLAPYAPPAASTILYNLTMLPSFFHSVNVDGSYWSLAFELIFYVLMGSILWWRLFSRIEMLCFCWIAVFAPIRFLFNPTLGIRGRELLLIHYGHLFIIGICIYRIWSGRAVLPTYILCALACCVSLLGSGPESGNTSGLPYFLITITFAALVWLAASDRIPALRFRPLLYFGELSYSFYLLHQMLGYQFINIANGAGATAAAAIAIAFALCGGLAWLLNRIVEVPARTRLRSRLTSYRERQIQRVSTRPTT
jgi:peptidoglycan/LPS O-acetylase OafA/YrhL